MRKRSRNPDSKVSSGFREKAKGDLTRGALALFHRLGLGRPVWVLHGDQRGARRYGDHFGSESLVDSARRADPGRRR